MATGDSQGHAAATFWATPGWLASFSVITGLQDANKLDEACSSHSVAFGVGFDFDCFPMELK